MSSDGIEESPIPAAVYVRLHCATPIVSQICRGDFSQPGNCVGEIALTIFSQRFENLHFCRLRFGGHAHIHPFVYGTDLIRPASRFVPAYSSVTTQSQPSRQQRTLPKHGRKSLQRMSVRWRSLIAWPFPAALETRIPGCRQPGPVRSIYKARCRVGTPAPGLNYFLRRHRGLQRIAPMDATCAFRNLPQATRFGGKNPLQEARNTDFPG